jgi:hypothetical protein
VIPIITYSTRDFPWIEVFSESVRRSGLRLVQIDNSAVQSSARNQKFKASYRHLSRNPLAFELACFDRYFAILDYASKNKISSFFMCDTDVLLNGKVGEDLIHLTEGLDVMLSRPQRGYPGYSEILEYSPHFSFWTTESIDDFIDFFVDAYCTEEGAVLIDQAYRSNAAHSAAGLSDMTLCHLWLNARRPKFRNSALLDGDLVIDHNMALSDHAFPNQFKKRSGIKSLVLADGGLHFQENNGKLFYPLIMHFQGKYKMIMKDVLNRSLTASYAKAAIVSGLRRVRTAWDGV